MFNIFLTAAVVVGSSKARERTEESKNNTADINRDYHIIIRCPPV